MSRKRWVSMMFGAIPVLVICAIGIGIGRLWEAWNGFQRAEQKTLQGVAQRLGVEADWETVNRHVYCEMLRPGMTQPVIEEQLAKIGPYSWKRDEVLTYLVYIYFEDNLINIYLGNMQLIFDENGLLKLPAKYTQMGDPNPMDCTK